MQNGILSERFFAVSKRSFDFFQKHRPLSSGTNFSQRSSVHRAGSWCFFFRSLFVLGLLFGSLDWAQANPASGSSSVPNPCLEAIRDYGLPQGVPGPVLLGIARVESSLHPWAVNVRGHAWFGSSREEMKALVSTLAQRGERSFDVGCMQMNYHWHHHRFASLDQMIDPGHNVYQASRFLLELHAEKGSWSKAVGAYHSRNSTRSRAYLNAVVRALEQKQ